RLRQHRQRRADNYGIARVEVLDGNVGYLDLRGFYSGPPAEAAVDAAMHLLQHTDALIVDLRRNGGGDPDLVRYVTSYFFDEPTHLNSLHWRDGDREVVNEFWTLEETASPQRPDLPLFVLTSDYTFSAGEEFANNLKALGRATLIGETTGGGANPGGMMPAGERFGVFVPTGRAVNPVTGTNWEGVGVEPDVAVPAEEALDVALERALPAAEAYRARHAERAEAAVTELRAQLDRARAQLAAGDAAAGEATVAAALHSAVEAGVLDEETVNGLGYAYLAHGDAPTAIAVFRFNVERYPASWNVYDSLGEALAEAGREAEAVRHYERARAMAPESQHARIDEVLGRLRAEAGAGG
ncbi:MAG: S41 family peptidase, partial [Rhodothermales bacterium]|nr:S41 family peptidase [Rhodothermales bacterium]